MAAERSTHASQRDAQPAFSGRSSRSGDRQEGTPHSLHPLESASLILQRIIERAPHAMAATEGRSHILQSVNPAFCRMMRVERASVLGQPFVEAFPDEPACSSLPLLDRVFRSGEPEADHEVSHPSGPPGSDVWSYTVWPVDNGNGQPAGLIIQVSDQTERSKSQRRLMEMADQIRSINERLLRSALQEQEWAEKAEAASRAKSDFLAIMSHELRTPLTGIVGYADILDAEAQGPINARQRESITRIKACSSHLRALIDGVLAFAQVEMGTAKVQLERTDLCELARQSASTIEPVADHKGLELKVTIPDRPLYAETDRRKVMQILLNLLSNAVKFTDQGSIRLALRVEGSEILFLVQDTGIGIPADEMERIFEPFVQVEAVTTRRFGGTGLGLAISRSLARILGGDVEVRSTPGKGSSFSLRLPFPDQPHTAPN